MTGPSVTIAHHTRQYGHDNKTEAKHSGELRITHVSSAKHADKPLHESGIASLPLFPRWVGQQRAAAQHACAHSRCWVGSNCSHSA